MKNSDSKLALQWGCDERTIRRWRKDSAPLGNAKAMFLWLATRKHLPPGTRALVDGQSRSAMGQAAAQVGTTVPAMNEDADTGAPAALRRLERFEAVAYRVLQTAIKTGDPAAIRNARDTWLKSGDSLRRYDLLVESARRTSDVMIPRGEVERHISNFVHSLRIGAMHATATLAPTLRAMDAIDLRETLRRQLADNMISCMAALASRPGKQQLPKWFIDAALLDIKDYFSSPGDTFAQRRDTFEHVFAKLVEANAKCRMKPASDAPEK